VSGPAPGGAHHGLVVASYRRHYAVRLDDGDEVSCVLKGRDTALACGDRVRVSRIAGGGVIDALLPRESLLYRSDGFKDRLIAANVTQIVGVVAPDVGLDEELVHRWTIAAEAADCALVIAANKSDDPASAALLARLAPFAALGYPVIALAARQSIAPLAERLADARTVLIGASGVGKSTILNAAVPGVDARTAEISTALRTGRHTTSHSTLHVLPGGSDEHWIIDSPGIKAFGLAHLAPEAIVDAFVEIRPLAPHCRFRDCRHDREPDCAVLAAVDRGAVAAHRVALLRALVAGSIAAGAPGR
jgi:ribosome biogenesis GTPase